MKKTLSLALLSYLLSIVFRLYWIWWAGMQPQFYWDNELMINTNDGYAFAEGAKDMLAGFKSNNLSYYGSPLSTFAYFIVNFFGIKLTTIMIYLPIFAGSLLVIAVFMICIRLGINKNYAFLASLAAGIANSYYNRSMAGYFDTDMLNVVLPTFLLYFMIIAVQKYDEDIKLSLKNSLFYYAVILCIAITISIYQWWYSSAYSLNSAMLGCFFIYTVVFQRYSKPLYAIFLLGLLSLVNLPIYIKFLAIILSYALILVFKFSKYILLFLFIIFTFLWAYLGAFEPIIYQLKFYLLHSDFQPLDTFNYFDVSQTIRESEIIDVFLLADRISSSLSAFVISVIGTVLLFVKRKEWLLCVPMLGLGFFAVFGGLRFSIYAVCINAIGFAFLIQFLSEKIKNVKFKFIILILSYSVALIPSLLHIYSYKVPTVFIQDEVYALEYLHKNSKNSDYTIAWWDYGYGIRYYSDTHTLIDGGKHLGKDNFATSFILTSDEISSSNMAKMAVEYDQKSFKENIKDPLKAMIDDNKFKNSKDFLLNLGSKDFVSPNLKQNIFYYLPKRMLYIFATIARFSQIDPSSGDILKDGIFYLLPSHDINLQGNIMEIKGQNIKIPLISFIDTYYQGKDLITDEHSFNGGSLYAINLKDDGLVVLVDESMFRSVFVQLFLLQRYDDALFEPFWISKDLKIYRLK